MYLSFYGLDEKPFNLTPDGNFLYPSQVHREVLTHLLYGIHNRKGFIIITGEVGAGKTTLCRVLLEHLDDDIEVAFILNSYLTELELLKSINEDLGIPTTGKTRKELIDELNRFLLERSSQGKNVVIIIDEAQNLSIPVLEQLRMLSNLETEKEKLLQIVLVGQPELDTLLDNEKIRQLRQRVTVRHHVTPLSRAETKEYIYHRLNAAGARGNVVFTEGAIAEVFRFSRGIPRSINVMCDQALLVGYVGNTRRITRSMVRRALKEIMGERRMAEARIPIYAAKSVVSRALAGAAVTAVAILSIVAIHFARNIRGNDADGITAPDTVEAGVMKDFLSKEEEKSPAEEATVEETHQDTVPETEDSDDAALDEGEPDTTDTPDDATSSIIMSALDLGAGRMLGRELSDVSSPIDFVDRGTAGPVIDDEPPPASLGEIEKWATETDATVDLLRLWKVVQRDVDSIQRRFTGKVVDPAKAAKIAQMGYVLVKSDLASLRDLNLPVVAQVRMPEGKRASLVIAKLSETQATIYVSSKKIMLDIDEVAPLLTGRMTIYCGDKFVNAKVLSSGMDLNINVRMLQDHLKTLGYFDGNSSGWFTADTEAAVLKFQSENNLKPTGQVTGYMKLLIYSKLPHKDGQVPRLSE